MAKTIRFKPISWCARDSILDKNLLLISSRAINPLGDFLRVHMRAINAFPFKVWRATIISINIYTQRIKRNTTFHIRVQSSEQRNKFTKINYAQVCNTHVCFHYNKLFISRVFQIILHILSLFTYLPWKAQILIILAYTTTTKLPD